MLSVYFAPLSSAKLSSSTDSSYSSLETVWFSRRVLVQSHSISGVDRHQYLSTPQPIKYSDKVGPLSDQQS